MTSCARCGYNPRVLQVSGETVVDHIPTWLEAKVDGHQVPVTETIVFVVVERNGTAPPKQTYHGKRTAEQP